MGFDTLIGQNSQVKIQSQGESFRSFVKTQSVFEKALYWLREGEQSSNQPRGTYEKRLYDSCPVWSFNLTAPGSNMPVDTYKCIDVLIKVLKYMSEDNVI